MSIHALIIPHSRVILIVGQNNIHDEKEPKKHAKKISCQKKEEDVVDLDY